MQDLNHQEGADTPKTYPSGMQTLQPPPMMASFPLLTELFCRRWILARC